MVLFGGVVGEAFRDGFRKPLPSGGVEGVVVVFCNKGGVFGLAISFGMKRSRGRVLMWMSFLFVRLSSTTHRTFE